MDRDLCFGVILVAVLALGAAPVSCSLSQNVLDQIAASRAGVDQIKNLVLNGERKSKTYDKLAYLSDYFPDRNSGSQGLEDAIDYILAEMKTEGFENVHGENVTVPKWTRGKEYGAILTPIYRPMSTMALGTSIGTTGNLTGQVIVVRSFDELEQKKNEVRGKIVVYNQAWKGYGDTVEYRSNGASRASEHGAIAALVRSVTDFSLYTPHTGHQTYDPNYPAIPVASISVEDAELLQRYYDRNENITVSMYSEAMNHPNSISRNVVGEIIGSTYPDQVVIFGGHIDAWDVTSGSLDDGGGVMISWEALSVIKKLNLKPKRTLRVVLWTSEEYGLIGGDKYYAEHMNDSGKVSLIMESDHGVFNPKGLHLSGCGLARGMLEEILKPLNDINTTTVLDGGGASSDTGNWYTEKGVPAVELYSSNEDYFFYHHTRADAMTMMDRDVLDRATVLWATTIYTVAMLDDMLPRTGDYPFTSTSTTTASSPFAFLLTLSATLLLIVFRLN
jgi:carboxypeptidase Q